MMTKHNVLIVDDHRITQSGLLYLFASLDRYNVVGTLDRGATVNAYVQSQPVDLCSTISTNYSSPPRTPMVLPCPCPPYLLAAAT